MEEEITIKVPCASQHFIENCSIEYHEKHVCQIELVLNVFLPAPCWQSATGRW